MRVSPAAAAMANATPAASNTPCEQSSPSARFPAPERDANADLPGPLRAVSAGLQTILGF